MAAGARRRSRTRENLLRGSSAPSRPVARGAAFGSGGVLHNYSQQLFLELFHSFDHSSLYGNFMMVRREM